MIKMAYPCPSSWLYNVKMNEKRLFRRSDAASAPGILIAGGRRYDVEFDNLSLVGARVKSTEGTLPPAGTAASLRLNDQTATFQVDCKVVGQNDGQFYRLKFESIGEGSLNNLLMLLRRFGEGGYNPEKELPNLILEIG
jgi:hypothetical protein